MVGHPALRALTLALALSAPALAAEVADPAHGFSFTPPEGYQPLPPTSNPAALHSLTRGTPDEPSYAAITISSMGAPLAPDSKLQPEVVKANAREAAARSGWTLARLEFRHDAWQGLDLDTVLSVIDAGGTSALSLATQVPLEPVAVMVMTAGPPAEEARLAKEHAALLASLHGASTRLPDGRIEDERLGPTVGFLAGLLVVTTVALVALIVAARRIRTRRRDSQG